MLLRQICCFVVAALLVTPNIAYSTESTIMEIEGHSCMGEDKSRKEAKQEALANAKRTAIENTLSYLTSETQVEDFQLKKDVIAAYSEGHVKVLETKEENWYKDEHSGDCFKTLLKVEVIPDVKETTYIDNPAAPLNVQLWTDKKEYKSSEKITIYIKGNKPFYGRLVYKDANNNLLQLLPNPYRTDNYFNGGVIYEIPSGNDKFKLEVTSPFGTETVTLYGSSSQVGDIDLNPAGGVYEVKTRSAEVGIMTRGVVIKLNDADKTKKIPAEFSENSIAIKTLSK